LLIDQFTGLGTSCRRSTHISIILGSDTWSSHEARYYESREH